MKVLDKGYVELDEHMGSDLAIVNNARQSFGQRSDEMKDKDVGLIHYLMKNRHGTPFERPVFSFNVKAPIFVTREWQRHRIGSFNEYSGRYSKMIEDYYLPDHENVRTQTGKPGNYTFVRMGHDDSEITRYRLQQQSDKAWEAYELMLEDGVAKEVARMCLPVNYYTMFSWTVNLRSLFNFISLRSDENAMWEIRQFSLAIEELIKPIVPIAYDAFVKAGRMTP